MTFDKAVIRAWDDSSSRQPVVKLKLLRLKPVTDNLKRIRIFLLDIGTVRREFHLQGSVSGRSSEGAISFPDASVFDEAALHIHQKQD